MEEERDDEINKVRQIQDLPLILEDSLLRAARGEVTPFAPVWAMRQAGRYLPEFRALRLKHGFFEICNTPELCAEVTLQPLRRFKSLDAVVIFSDILIVPQAMGMEVRMQPGPFFPSPIRKPVDIDALLDCQPSPLGNRLDTTFQNFYKKAFESHYNGITLTRKMAAQEGRSVPVIGFCGGPWTLFAYMVDGGLEKNIGGEIDLEQKSKKNENSEAKVYESEPPNPAASKDDGTKERARLFLYSHAEHSHKLLSALAVICAELLIGQWRAGASILQVFESNAGDLPHSLFSTFSLPYLFRIAEIVRLHTPSVKDGGPPLILFPRNAYQADLYETVRDKSLYDAISLDWIVDASEAVKRVTGPTRILALQGNLDPVLLHASPSVLVCSVLKMLKKFGFNHPLICNLGHGMHPSHRHEKLSLFFDAVHELSRLGRLKLLETAEEEDEAIKRIVCESNLSE
jgi:uroporphyrinogen decarboxylase